MLALRPPCKVNILYITIQPHPHALHMEYNVQIIHMSHDIHLTNQPIQCPDSCLSLSNPLLQTLTSILPTPPKSTLSIGSGTGLLESLLLLQHNPKHTCNQQQTLNIHGIEVSFTVNKYLPEQNFSTVNGTWDISPLAAEAEAWMFVYPREIKLVRTYLEEYASGKLEMIVWLGPRSDWDEYRGLLKGWEGFAVEVWEECGIASYEVMAVARRSLRSR